MQNLASTAVFIADYTISNSPSILNLLEFLSGKSIVDVYLNNVALKDCAIWQQENVRVADFGPNPLGGSFSGRLRGGYDNYIAIDPHGLVFCNQLFPNSRPVYYSLELYLKNDHFGLNYPAEIMQAERGLVNRIKGLIIQSQEKNDLFCADYNLSRDIPTFILPVTYKGPSVSRKSQWLRQKYNISSDKKIALHLGGVAEFYSCGEIACTFAGIKDWVLFFQGYPNPHYEQSIKDTLSRHNVKNVIFSEKLYDHIGDVDQVTQSCDLGIAWYNDISTGFRAAGKSSGKIPAYMRFGLPIIAKGYPSTIDAIEKIGAGVCVDEYDEITNAVKRIENNYSQYSQNALAEYDRSYNFENYADSLMEFIQNKDIPATVVAPVISKVTDRTNHSNRDKVPEKVKKAEGNCLSGRYNSCNDKLSILQTVEFYAPHLGGAELVVQEVSERLAKRGHNVTVTTSYNPDRKFRELNGVEVKQFDISTEKAYGSKGDIAGYKQYLIESQADVVMNYAAQQWATNIAFETLQQTRERRVNVIAPCGHSGLIDSTTARSPEAKDYYSYVIPAVIPLYDAAVYHSAMYKDYEYAQNHGFTNSIVIPNGIGEEEFLSEPKVDFRSKYGINTRYMGLCVANFYAGKGHERILECFEQMNRNDFTVVLIGKEGDKLPFLKEATSGMNIRICADIPRQDTVAAYHAADLFLFGSHNEASPLVIIEAKASKTPFVSTDCGNVREWKGGIVCPPERMAHYANRLIDDRQLYETLARDGWNEWKEKLTWEKVVDRYEELYLQLYYKKTKKTLSV